MCRNSENWSNWAIGSYPYFKLALSPWTCMKEAQLQSGVSTLIKIGSWSMFLYRSVVGILRLVKCKKGLSCSHTKCLRECMYPQNSKTCITVCTVQWFSYFLWISIKGFWPKYQFWSWVKISKNDPFRAVSGERKRQPLFFYKIFYLLKEDWTAWIGNFIIIIH